MGRRENNVLIFQDTVEYFRESEKLMLAAARTRRGQKVILEEDRIPARAENQESRSKRTKRAKIIVSEKRTLEAASAYKNRKVCVLNFASATDPGGGVLYGSSAQEESLCRCSTLYLALTADELETEFYEPHSKSDNPLYNDDLIYSPDVVVIKSDTSSPKRLPEEEWYTVNVITCAAPNLRDIPSSRMNPDAGDHRADISEEELSELLVKRIRRIFAVAAEEGNEVLILGAFGCGAFRNPPRVVAEAFHEVTDEYRKDFETIEYAVFHTDAEMENYEAFVSEFRQEMRSSGIS